MVLKGRRENPEVSRTRVRWDAGILSARRGCGAAAGCSDGEARIHALGTAPDGRRDTGGTPTPQGGKRRWVQDDLEESKSDADLCGQPEAAPMEKQPEE